MHAFSWCCLHIVQEIGNKAVPMTKDLTEDGLKPAAHQVAEGIEPTVKEITDGAMRPIGKVPFLPWACVSFQALVLRWPNETQCAISLLPVVLW